MAVLPSDHYIPDREQFAELLRQAGETAKKYGLVTFGITPRYPETGYGYICRGDRLDSNAFKVERFVEKPDQERAAAYLKDSRFLWNSGMFIFEVGALMAAYRRHLPAMAAALDGIDFADAGSVEEAYAKMTPISIDYGIMEQAADVVVIPAEISWERSGQLRSLPPDFTQRQFRQLLRRAHLAA